MKILHVIRDLSPATGGPVAAIKALVQTQAHMGHDVVVVTTDYELPDANFTQDKGPEYVICRCRFGFWRYSPEMWHVLATWVPWCDVVHVHMLWEYPTLAAIHMARKLEKPFLLRSCGMLDRWSMSQSLWKKRIYLALFSKTLFSPPCVLHFTTEAEREKSLVVAGRDAVVIANGVEGDVFELYSSKPFLDHFPDLRGQRIALFLGRLHPKKRPDIAIEAFALVAPRFPDTTLVLAGPGEPAYVQSLKALVDVHGVNGRVYFSDLLQGDLLYSAYRSASLFLLPSLQENFGIAVVEAMAAGCPVIVSSHVDIHPHIEQGGAGLVCELQPLAFGTAMETILGHPDKATRMGQRGQSIAKQLFSWDVAATQLDKAYSQLVNGSSPPIDIGEDTPKATWI